MLLIAEPSFNMGSLFRTCFGCLMGFVIFYFYLCLMGLLIVRLRSHRAQACWAQPSLLGLPFKTTGFVVLYKSELYHSAFSVF